MSIELNNINKCIICFETENLIKMECHTCNGIYIHFDCLVELQDYSNNKCPVCRDNLKYHIIPIQDQQESDELSDTEIDQILENIELENENNLTNCDKLFIKINQIIVNLLLLICYLLLGFIIGKIILLFSCFIVNENCYHILNFSLLNSIISTIVGISIIICHKGLVKIEIDNNPRHRSRIQNPQALG